jgi:hypothetical protein
VDWNQSIPNPTHLVNAMASHSTARTGTPGAATARADFTGGRKSSLRGRPRWRNQTQRRPRGRSRARERPDSRGRLEPPAAGSSSAPASGRRLGPAPAAAESRALMGVVMRARPRARMRRCRRSRTRAAQATGEAGRRGPKGASPGSRMACGLRRRRR